MDDEVGQAKDVEVSDEEEESNDDDVGQDKMIKAKTKPSKGAGGASKASAKGMHAFLPLRESLC